ncbi:hypothetical protein [Umezakia ovalisporum]|uniref:hypothetical protein n=1 Tax=Umezakia ovalisporum TaxID=75695 RepID=UPI0039C71377
MTLAELGRTTSDPLLLVAAARALSAIGKTIGQDQGLVGAITRRKALAGVGSSNATIGPTQSGSMLDRLLNEARQLARGNAAVLAIIDDTATTVMKGSTAGPHTHEFQIEAEKSMVFIERFTAERLAEVAIKGNGYSDLDLRIIDQNGVIICESAGNTDQEYCGFTPIITGAFSVEVLSYGGETNEVYLILN